MKTSPNSFALSVWRRIGLTAILTLAVSDFSHAASFHSTWTGGGDGTSWSDASNWTTANSPQDGSDIYHAYVDNGAGDITIITSADISTRGLTLTQAEGGSTTLKLGGNYQITDSAFAAGTGVFNTSGSAAGVVIDLNGYQLSLSGVALARQSFKSGAYTLKSSATDGSGAIVISSFTEEASVVVQDNVTVKLTGGVSYLSSVTWSEGSTLQLVGTGGGNQMNATSPVSLGTLIIGDSGNTAGSVFSINNTNITVRGNVTLESFTGATGGSASRISFSNASQSLRVGGNFTDHGTDNSNYGSNTSATGTIYFVGGSDAEKVVSIGRTGLRNAFQVGDASADGNVALGRNLQTMGGVTVQEDSRLNVRSFTLQSGAFTAEEGATIGFELGGVINTTTLTLGSFNLELLGDWSSYDTNIDLRLFSYSSISGTPTVESFLAPDGLAFERIYLQDGGVYLQFGEVIPEPSTWALMGISGLLLASRFRRRA